MKLMQGETVLGAIVIESCDMPWWHGHFEPQPPFEAVRSLFDELALAIDAQRDPAVMSDAYTAVMQLGLSLAT